MVHQDYRVNVDQGENKVLLDLRELPVLKARMAYLDLMVCRETEEPQEPPVDQVLKGDRVFQVCLVEQDSLELRVTLVRKAIKVLLEKLVEMVTRVVMVLRELLVNQVCQDLRAQTDHQESQEDEEIVGRREAVDHLVPLEVQEFLDHRDQLAPKDFLEQKEMQAKRVRKEREAQWERRE